MSEVQGKLLAEGSQVVAVVVVAVGHSCSTETGGWSPVLAQNLG